MDKTTRQCIESLFVLADTISSMYMFEEFKWFQDTDV